MPVSITVGTSSSVVAVMYFVLSVGAMLKMFARTRVLRSGSNSAAKKPPTSGAGGRGDGLGGGLGAHYYATYAAHPIQSPSHRDSSNSGEPRVKRPLHDVQMWFCAFVALLALGRSVDAIWTLLVTSQTFMHKRLYAHNELMVNVAEMPPAVFLLGACACQFHLWLDTMHNAATWQARKPKVYILVWGILVGAMVYCGACVLQSQMSSWPVLNYVFVGFVVLCASSFLYASWQAYKILRPMSETLAAHANDICRLSGTVSALFFARAIFDFPPLQDVAVAKYGQEDVWLYFQFALLIMECLPMAILLRNLPHRRTR